MHNGYVNEFATIKRDLAFAVEPSLYPKIQGQADSEVLFLLALTFGLEDDPPVAIERTIGLVEAVAARLGVSNPFQGTIATTDGAEIWAFRYSSEGKSRSLFYTTDIPTLRRLYPERKLFQEVSEDARVIVSEPLGDVAGVWHEVPEATCAIVGRGHDELRPFRPRTPSKLVPVRALWDLNARGHECEDSHRQLPRRPGALYELFRDARRHPATRRVSAG